MTNRLFIGLDFPRNVIHDLINIRDDIYGSPNDLNWESEDKLHVTLKFLGDVGKNIEDLLIQRLENFTFNSIKAEFDKFAFFKRNGRLNILFASLKKNEKLAEFYRLIEEECELIGFTKERRRFYPHITLLRLKGKEDINRLINFNNNKINYPEFTVNGFSIYQSTLKPAGSEYLKLKSFNLY